MTTNVTFNDVVYGLQDQGQAIDWQKADLSLLQALAANSATTGGVFPGTIEAAGLISSDALVGTAPSGVGITVNQSAAMTSVVHKVTVTFENMLIRSGGTADLTIWTLPAKTKLMRVIAAVTEAWTGGDVSDFVVIVGKTAGAAEYLLASDLFAGAAVFGDALNEEGLSLSDGVGEVNWASTQALVARFTATGADVSELTAGSVTFYIETVQYP